MLKLADHPESAEISVATGIDATSAIPCSIADLAGQI
jgi:hypothetical protein